MPAIGDNIDGLISWVDDRLGLASLRGLLAHKSVPRHSATAWYYFGGITLFFFVIQVLTGILLLLYYRPTAAEAYESVQFIMTDVQFGWLVRSIHSWSANLMILAAFIHMFSVVFLHAYRKPREVTWLSGIALLGLALGFGFSGYLLPWNTISYFATKVGTDMAASMPLIGPALARFLRGGNDVGGATLTRFFGFHVAVLPGLTTVLLAVHLALIQKWNISVPPKVELEHSRRGTPIPRMPFVPNFFLRELMAWYGALGVLGVLAAHLPLGARREGRPICSGPGRHPARVVLPGSVLHVEADSQSRLGHRRRASRSHRIRGPGDLVGLPAVLGHGSQRPHPDPPGDRSRHPAAGLSGHILGPGVLVMNRDDGCSPQPNDEGSKVPMALRLATRVLQGSVALAVLATGLWAQNSCLDCHSALEGDLATPAARWSSDVHSTLGFTCANCHGGDPAETDPEGAMSRARGFRGRIARTAIPELCGSCHSDATLIHKFDPQERIDQLAQYKTSVHGQRLAAGDSRVATCIDCHSVHDIRKVDDANSPVHPLNIPETCARCHADAELMANYGIGSSQFSDYRESVHWQALAERGDLSAPNCASCHGNHGATPPEVASVTAVCGHCHVLLQNLFEESPHQPAFEAMGMAGCIVCHGNHRVQHPTPDLLVGDDAVCSQCHGADDAGGQAANKMHALITNLNDELEQAQTVLEEARQAGMEVSDALLRVRDGHEDLVRARVAVHRFQTAAVAEPVNEGLEIAREANLAGQAALHEKDVRRIGLGLSLITILVTMVGLWLTIRFIERKRAG